MSRREATAFVTGAASGLGLAIAKRLADDGLFVVVTDIDEERGLAAALSVGEAASFHRCDIADIGSVRVAAASVKEERGSIEVLVNNAGFDRPGFFLETEPDMWDALLAVNLSGVLNCTYVIAPEIVESCRAGGYGRIVNIASDAGRVGSMGEAVYSAAKGGVIAFSKSMARELARDRVTVNALCPGPAETPMTDLLRQDPVGGRFIEQMTEITPLKRLATAEEVAAAVSYFVSEEARFVTGQVLSVSGGLTMAG